VVAAQLASANERAERLQKLANLLMSRMQIIADGTLVPMRAAKMTLHEAHVIQQFAAESIAMVNR